jgi:hypothetical protein
MSLLKRLFKIFENLLPIVLPTFLGISTAFFPDLIKSSRLDFPDLIKSSAWDLILDLVPGFKNRPETLLKPFDING